MLHYFANIYGSLERAKAVCYTVQNQFKQVEQYLNNSIDALRKKGKIKAAWEEIKTAELCLIPGSGIYKYTLSTVITTGILLKEKMILSDSSGAEYTILKKDNDNFTIKGKLPSNIKLFYNELEIPFTVKTDAKLPVKNVEILSSSENDIIFYSEKDINANNTGIEKIKISQDHFNINEIVYDSDPDNKPDIAKKENSGDLIIVLNNKDDIDKIVRYKKIKFVIKELKMDSIDNNKIRLKEINNNYDNDDIYTGSQLNYFFEENVTIYDDNNNEYIADKKSRNKDEFEIVLRRKPTKENPKRTPCKPPEGSILQVKVNTQPLKCQREAINILKQMPHEYHKMLLKLFENKDDPNVKWGKIDINEKKIDKWYVLTDDKRSGYEEQREFIKKAVNTPDFALLEGPPGSGKTTVILELICQFIAHGKKVLLCGSTNVAIDNVLERLVIKKNNSPSLLELIETDSKIVFLPVRIGPEDKVDESIEKFHIDKLTGKNISKEQKKLKTEMLLAAANLVCGTTMGIINHPKFKNQSKTDNDKSGNSKPIVPEFDILIIDESSKTTFQEFLVPALYAKKWILAGDVMQLSPFTEQESIEYNFKKLIINGKVMSEYTQQAVFYLLRMKANFFYYRNKKTGRIYHNKFIMQAPSMLIEKIVNELTAGRIKDFNHDEIFLCITKKKLQIENEDEQKQIIMRTYSAASGTQSSSAVKFLELNAADLILVDETIFDNVMNELPSTHAMLMAPDWKNTPFAYKHNYYRQQNKFGWYKNENEDFNDSFEFADKIFEDFKESSWHKEIAWRVNSEYSLRLADKSGRREDLRKKIEYLRPYSADNNKYQEAVNLISEMSFPSILESLVRGVKGKETKKLSTISVGFNKENGDLQARRTILTYQHRMHPDISEFPRKRFYEKKDELAALKDLEQPPIKETRIWNYKIRDKNDKIYDNRSIWVDVNSPTKGSKNIFEAEAMIKELNKFLKFIINYKPEGKCWEVACLAFYRGQEEIIRDGDFYNNKKVHGLRTLLDSTKMSSFDFNENENRKSGTYPVHIKLCSVDRYQGHEADLVLLSMSQTHKDGFLDNPNRLNVAITRAKYQLLIFGKYDYYSRNPKSEYKTKSDDLYELALSHKDSVIKWNLL